jgi:hypothetical protein
MRKLQIFHKQRSNGIPTLPFKLQYLFKIGDVHFKDEIDAGVVHEANEMTLGYKFEDLAFYDGKINPYENEDTTEYKRNY